MFRQALLTTKRLVMCRARKCGPWRLGCPRFSCPKDRAQHCKSPIEHQEYSWMHQAIIGGCLDTYSVAMLYMMGCVYHRGVL